MRVCQGSVLLLRGRLRSALQHYEEALQRQPNSAAALAGRAAIRVNQLVLSRVGHRLLHRAAHRAEQRLCLWNQGGGLCGIGQVHQGDSYADKAIALRSGEFTDYYNRGVAHHYLGDDDLALTDLTVAVQLAPDQACNYSARASVYLALKDYDRAVADATEAIRQEPNGGSPYQTRGQAWPEKGL